MASASDIFVFIHFQNKPNFPVNFDFDLLIRSVSTINNNSIVFGGNFSEKGKVLVSQPESGIPEFLYENKWKSS